MVDQQALPGERARPVRRFAALGDGLVAVLLEKRAHLHAQRLVLGAEGEVHRSGMLLRPRARRARA